MAPPRSAPPLTLVAAPGVLGRATPVRRALLVAACVAAVAALHASVPAGPHAWHWLHLAAQKLHLVPVLLAVVWFGPWGVAAVTAAVSALFLAHVLGSWRGEPMVQAEQIADLGSLWLVAALATGLVGWLRAAHDATGRAHAETLSALALSLELRERYTAGHSQRVRDYSLLLAGALDLPAARRRDLAVGAWLHDVGKIGVPDAVLHKEDVLDPAEWALIRRHPDAGAELVGAIPSLRPVAALVRAHHERWDGHGYPRGLAGEAIPLEARIFAVADAFDAITTDRPYHRAERFTAAARAIERGRGTQFDPQVVEAFQRIQRAVWLDTAARGGVALDVRGAADGAAPDGDRPTLESLARELRRAPVTG